MRTGHCEHHSTSGNRARTLGTCFLSLYQQFIIVKTIYVTWHVTTSSDTDQTHFDGLRHHLHVPITPRHSSRWLPDTHRRLAKLVTPNVRVQSVSTIQHWESGLNLWSVSKTNTLSQPALAKHSSTARDITSSLVDQTHTSTAPQVSYT